MIRLGWRQPAATRVQRQRANWLELNLSLAVVISWRCLRRSLSIGCSNLYGCYLCICACGRLWPALGSLCVVDDGLDRSVGRSFGRSVGLVWLAPLRLLVAVGVSCFESWFSGNKLGGV